MRHESILRQVALVSYGTQFLRDEIELEDWYRHGVFFDARLQFRDQDNTLLADDFTLWLEILKASGATRLSLHLAGQFDIDLPRTSPGEGHAVVAHFADRHEIWTVGSELPGWLTHPLRPQERWIPNSTSWGGAIDTYWRVADLPGKLEVVDTNWKALTAAIALDLDLAIPSVSPLGRAAPFCVAASRNPPWAKFPLFPVTTASAQAHLLLTILDAEEAAFANDTHPKNESSAYRQMGDADAAEMMARGMRLRNWLTEVLLRSANEYGSSAGSNERSPPVRLQTPPPGFERGAAASQEAGDIEAEPAPGKWLGRIGSVIGFAALCLFVLAIANIIARFPWLSVLIALPWVLYLKFRKDL